MRMKRVLSLVLAVVMMLSVVPVVFADDMVLSNYSVNSATTNVGEMPLLPDRAILTFENGDILVEYITWNEFDESLYAVEGTFEVTGVTESGYEVKTTVTVEKNSDTDIASGLIAHYNFDYDDSDILKRNYVILRSLKYTQLVGRAFADQYGALDGTDIETLMHTVYSVPQKIIYAMLMP